MTAHRSRSRLTPVAWGFLLNVGLWLAMIGTFCAVTGCDAPVDEVEPEPEVLEQAEAELVEPAVDPGPAPVRVSAPRRTRRGAADPCADYGSNPGVTLTNGTAFDGEVLVADLCIATIASVDGCWVSDNEADPDLLDLWCDFTCESGDVTVDIVASFPPIGTDIRVEWPNPCPVEVAS